MERETAEKAARWWADKLRNGCKFDNGDSSETGAMGMMLALMLADTLAKKRTDDQISIFETSLADAVSTLDDWAAHCGFGVDYHPDPILSEAAIVAEITVDGALPWKTRMQIVDDAITVSEGYCARSVEL